MSNFNVSKDIVIKKVNEIRPYGRNPRDNEVTVEKLVKIIPIVGFNVPIVVDKNGIIVKGHARFKAGIRLGMEEFPCIISEATDKQNKLDRISDNRMSEFSEWHLDTLKEELATITTLDVSSLELEAFNLDQVSTDSVNESLEAPSLEDVSGLTLEVKPAQKWIKVICEKCGHTQFVENNKNVFLDYGKTPKDAKEELI